MDLPALLRTLRRLLRTIHAANARAPRGGPFHFRVVLLGTFSHSHSVHNTFGDSRFRQFPNHAKCDSCHEPRPPRPLIQIHAKKNEKHRSTAIHPPTNRLLRVDNSIFMDTSMLASRL